MIIVRGTRGYFVCKAFGCGSVNSVYNWSLDLDFRFDRVSWPIKQNVTKKIYHRVVIDKTINENMMPSFFILFKIIYYLKAFVIKKHISLTIYLITIIFKNCKINHCSV